MSLLSYNALCGLIESGVITNCDKENVNSASIDLTLGDKIMVERRHFSVLDGEPMVVTVDMLDKAADNFYEYTMNNRGYVLAPGECVLAHTVEVFNLPNWLSAEYKLKSTQARNFLNHLNAGWADAGWHGSVLTLEFVNHNRYHAIRIKPGIKCGQMVFFEHEDVPEDRSYAVRGQYNNDETVTKGGVLK